MRKAQLIPPNLNFVMKQREEGVRGREREGFGVGRRKGSGERGKKSLRFKQVSQFLGPPGTMVGSAAF